MKIKLTPPYFFTIEPFDNRLRLIVLKNQEEYVCRKETKNNVIRFINADDSSLFKGRLQLIKQNNEILIQAKNEVLGNIPIHLIQQLLETI